MENSNKQMGETELFKSQILSYKEIIKILEG